MTRDQWKELEKYRDGIQQLERRAEDLEAQATRARKQTTAMMQGLINLQTMYMPKKAKG